MTAGIHPTVTLKKMSLQLTFFKISRLASKKRVKESRSKPRFVLLKVVGLILHYLVTFVTRWLTPLALTFAGVIIVVVLLSHLSIVMSPFIDGAETFASKNIGERVKIHKMRTSLLPQPRLVLDQVSVGNASDIQMKSVSIALTWNTLFSTPIPIHQIELAGTTVTPQQIKRMANWFSHMLVQSELNISHFTFRDITIQLSNTKLPILQADVSMAPTGNIASATLSLAEQDANAVITAYGNDYKCRCKPSGLRYPSAHP